MHQLNVLIGLIGKDLDTVDKDDIYKLLADIERSDRRPATIRDYKITIKRVFRWLNGGKDPEMTAWIQTRVKTRDKLLPEELLTEDEIKQMIESAKHPRDKALIAMLYDSGARIGEIGTLCIKHLSFTQTGGYAMVKGKTGMRRIILIFSPSYLAQWLNIHPDKNNPNAFLWVNIGKSNWNEPMKYPAISRTVRVTAKRAGIKKRIYNHLFRHSRATEFAGFMSQAQLEMHMGWVHGTGMSATYLHLQGDQVNNTILEHYGLEEKPKDVSTLKPITCSRCKTVNGPTSDFCSSCGMAFSIEAVNKTEEVQNQAIDIMMRLVAAHPELLDYVK